MTQDLQVLFDKHIAAKNALVEIQGKIADESVEILPEIEALTKKLAAVKAKYDEELRAAFAAQTTTKVNLESAIASGAFGRTQLEGDSWVQRNKNRQTPKVTDIPAFLQDPLALRVIESIKLKKSAILALLETGAIKGVVVEAAPSVRIHIVEKKEEKENDAE